MRLEINVRHLDDGTAYILIDEIDERHRDRVYFLADAMDELFDVSGHDACSPVVLVTYSDSGNLTA